MNMKNGGQTPLHMASTLSELIQRSEIKKIPQLKIPRYIAKMNLLHDVAEKAKKDGDQEVEFMYLHRYTSIVSKLCQDPEYKKNENNYKKEKKIAKYNFERYQTLHQELAKRYAELTTRANGSHPRELVIEQNDVPKENNARNKTVSEKKIPVSMSCNELYSLIKNKPSNSSLLLLDSRPSRDFQESHITYPNTINIPEEMIEKGVTASVLGKKLPPESKVLWDQRHKYDKLIIHDWSSTESTINSSKLLFLKEAMTKWDPTIQYKCPPIIVNGGFEGILDHYPFLLTNHHVQVPSQKPSFVDNSLISLTYPMADLIPEPVVPPPQLPEPEIPKPPISQKQLVIDRSTKPKKLSEIQSRERVQAEEQVVEPDCCSEEEGEIWPPPGEEEVKVVPKEPPIEIKLKKLRKVKPVDLTPASPPPIPPVVNEEPTNGVPAGVEFTPLKRGDSSSSILKRASSSPNITQLKDDDTMKMPAFTRNNKPKVVPFYGDRADDTYGKTAAGLTGLKNFANNCYMNSIVQCLSNTEELVKELIDLNKPALNPSSKTKGQVAQEVITTLRSMWSGDIKVYSIKELKGLMGDIKDIFKGTSHQDSNEFLIILLEYLHEDLNISNTVCNNLEGAEEATGEKAWGEFLKKNCSVIQRLFYGQQKSTIVCSTCNHSSVTFEPFFNLFVPIPSTQERVTLNECIKLYMSGEKISGWKCPKCQTGRNATKKFDISKLPPILIIALKRFTQEDDSWLHKKENTVTYPLQGLDMETFAVRESEQRFKTYNLYAMSTHTGTLRSGHYRAICKNPMNRKWYMFDDQSIDPLVSHSVENNPEAYILFYNAVK